MNATESFAQIDTSRVPFRIGDGAAIPVERYTSPEFLELECDHLWPRVWQVACRIEEVPSVGDFAEYEIADQSILIVRSSPETIRAYFNTCRHRGSQPGV